MIIDLYSNRNAPPCKQPVYDQIRRECRMQIANIARDFFLANNLKEYSEKYTWPFIQRVIKDAHFIESLYKESAYNAFGGKVSASSEVLGYLKTMEDLNKGLDVIELIFSIIVKMPEFEKAMHHSFEKYPPADAVNDLNKRFSQHCLGYKFEGDMIIRIDSELLYETITKEVLVFLTNPVYHNIDYEYRQAHKHYRNGDYKDCIANASKAFESTMKVICNNKGYVVSETATAAPLLKALFDNQFIPNYIQTELTSLQDVLGKGVTVVRNKTSGHGAGSSVIVVSESLAVYVLNMAGSNIKFLLSLLHEK
jgi:hypothetical protein